MDQGLLQAMAVMTATAFQQAGVGVAGGLRAGGGGGGGSGAEGEREV